MTFYDDYGIYLKEQGDNEETIIEFKPFTLSSFMIISQGLYSSTVNIQNDNKTYTLSLNFNHYNLEKILTYTSDENKTYILNEIDKKSNVIRKVNLKDKIEFTVLSKLGELEENEHEKFIPLEVHDIL
ncbi:MAG: hypothetical protein MJK08_08010 [Campylobacterales bacterium]|nr:hypothetical protein [Campylobacterales bacterium]